jgi:hypothetical protein
MSLANRRPDPEQASTRSRTQSCSRHRTTNQGPRPQRNDASGVPARIGLIDTSWRNRRSCGPPHRGGAAAPVSLAGKVSRNCASVSPDRHPWEQLPKLSALRLPNPHKVGPLTLFACKKSEGSRHNDAPAPGCREPGDPNGPLPRVRMVKFAVSSYDTTRAPTGVSAGQGLVVCLNTERARRDSNPQPSDP